MMNDRAEAGDREAIRASEEAIKRNVQMILDYTNETRKMLLELRMLFDNLQGHVINQRTELQELRRQLALVQQKIYASGTVEYEDGN